jgi:hypothetical protein
MCLGRFFRGVGRALTGEWMFGWGWPNGENVIFWRSVQITALLYLLGQWLRSLFDAGCSTGCHLDVGGLWQGGTTTATWLGAIFAAVWSSLFARFVSDRNYLAGVFNQIRSVQANGANPDHATFLHLWQAGFIADAYDLHLATNPLFGPFIYRLLTDYDGPVGTHVVNMTHLSEQDRDTLKDWLKTRFGNPS